MDIASQPNYITRSKRGNLLLYLYTHEQTQEFDNHHKRQHTGLPEEDEPRPHKKHNHEGSVVDTHKIFSITYSRTVHNTGSSNGTLTSPCLLLSVFCDSLWTSRNPVKCTGTPVHEVVCHQRLLTSSVGQNFGVFLPKLVSVTLVDTLNVITVTLTHSFPPRYHRRSIQSIYRGFLNVNLQGP